jgi:hypothetical protein
VKIKTQINLHLDNKLMSIAYRLKTHDILEVNYRAGPHREKHRLTGPIS